MRRIANTIGAVLLACGAASFACAQPAARAATAVPRLVKFSGALTDAGGKPLSGVLGVTFSLYEVQEGGAPIWMETQNVEAGAGGGYTVLLGATRNAGLPAELFGSGERWLGVHVQGAPAEGPRVLITSVPYSLKAVDAETLGGLPASAFALANAAGRGEIGETSAALSPKAAKPAAGAAPNLTGTGTANYIPLWTSTTALGSSKLYETAAGSVGLGTTTPAGKFEAVAASATGTAVLGSATSATGTTYGVYGGAVSPNGTGVAGNATSGTGVSGVSSSAAGYGVYGGNAATAGNAFGVFGATASPAGSAVFGSNTAVTGSAYAVNGVTNSTAGVAVLGLASASSGATYGVYGSVVSPSGIAVNGAAVSGTGVAGTTTSPAAYGVYGGNAATTGNAFGIYGISSSPAGYGIYGANAATTGPAYGVFGSNASTAGVGMLGQATAATGSTYGVYGSVVSPSGIAVYGTATKGTGVAGGTSSATGYGVYGANASTTGSALGVYGQTASTSGRGVEGVSTATSGTTYGVYGSTVSPSGAGVAANATAGGTALLATATGGGNAGQFNGNVQITGNLHVGGTLSKSSGSFRIDHPLDPEHKYLYHSFVESPDMMNIYNGVVTLSRHGDAVVKLPDWFGALNKDFRYQLTCIGGFAPVFIAAEVSGNQFKIAGGRAGMKISWQVTGIRNDAYAQQHRIPVEEDKQGAKEE